MLDVHAPEHPVHGVRDFLIHLLTITVGLLIALGLENIAEYAHHRHLVKEARENLRREVEDNRRDLQSMQDAIPAEQQHARELLAFLHARSLGQRPDLHSIQMGIVITTPQDASWQTANATGALSYMAYATVQRYATAYQLQKKIDSLQDATFPPLIELTAALSGMATGTIDPNGMSHDDAGAAEKNVREVMAHVETLRELGIQLDHAYADILTASD